MVYDEYVIGDLLSYTLLDRMPLTASTAYLISGLDGNTDIEYIIRGRIKATSTGVGGDIAFYPNEDNGTNKNLMAFYFGEGTHNTDTYADASYIRVGSIFGVNGAVNDITFQTYVYAKTGDVRKFITHTQNYFGGGKRYYHIYDGVWYDTSNNLTKISLTSSLALTGAIEIFKKSSTW